jgi:hypothetical protein
VRVEEANVPKYEESRPLIAAWTSSTSWRGRKLTQLLVGLGDEASKVPQKSAAISSWWKSSA